MITLRFTRLVFGLVCSPFILNVKLRNYLSKYENVDPKFVDTVVRALYVDDFAAGKDPLGLLSPVILPLKCMFQEICRLKIGWDKALSEDPASRWKELLEEMERVSNITVPRCILDGVEVGDTKSIRLH